MFKIFRTFLLILFLVSTTTAVYSETSWISKKSDKTKVELKKEKEEKKEKKKKWIAKKKEKKEKNKKKLKEKIKESKSWITKKSKDKLNEIKKNLKKHRNIENLPKAELYFAAMIVPSEDQEDLYLYGYINSDKKSDKSEKLKFNNTSYYSLNDGILYFDDGKTSCQADVQKDVTLGYLLGKIIITCKKKEVIGAIINFKKNGKYGKGDGEYTSGSNVEFYFYPTKKEAKDKLSLLKEKKTIIAERQMPATIPPVLEPNGKYYALLIGNSNYSREGGWDNLVTPKNDVTELSKILKNKYEFKVITGIDLTRNEMFDKFDELKEIVSDKDYVLVYYSGHGASKESERYWIPVNGSKKNKRNWINIDDITVMFEGDQPEIPSTHLALLVDSCWFKTKGSDNVNNTSKALTKIFNKRAAVVLSSGSDERVDEPHNKKHSAFGDEIIKTLENANSPIRLYSVYQNVSNRIENLDQTPNYYTVKKWNHRTGGDFIFIPQT